MDFLSDPGGIVYALIAAAVIVGVYVLFTRAAGEPADDEFAKRYRDPQDVARGRRF